MPELTDAEVLLLYTGVVLAVMFVFLALLGRRMGGRSRAANQKVVGLTNQHRLHVVDLDGRRLLVGTGPSGAPNLLSELDDEPAWARDATPPEGSWARTRVIAHGGQIGHSSTDRH